MKYFSNWIIIDHWLTLNLNSGPLDYFSKLTIISYISCCFRIVLSWRQQHIHIYCWLDCQRFEAKSRDLTLRISFLLHQTKAHAPKKTYICLANEYLFGKQLYVWQTSICLANKYLFETKIPKNTWYLSLFDNHLVPNTLYLSPCSLCFLDATQWILLYIW